jgi:hypothetical protein
LTREFRIKRLSGEAFLDVIKAFDTIFFDGPNYNLAINNFPSYLLKTYLPAYIVGISKRSLSSHNQWSDMGAGVSQGGIISLVLCSLYVNDIPILSHHAELSLYADNTATLSTSRQAALLVISTDSYRSD